MLFSIVKREKYHIFHLKSGVLEHLSDFSVPIQFVFKGVEKFELIIHFDFESEIFHGVLVPDPISENPLLLIV